MFRIRGVSARTRAAIRRAEDYPNAVFNALDRFERTFRQPGRYLNAPYVYSPGLEVEDARDDLEKVLRRLPEGARKDLGRLVARIDTEFERRTLPDPGPAVMWTAGRWWWWRIRDR
ncbi:hypothetical protein B4N89_35845 [Embleya scabrispora]|uniref:Uncharacterized protein n=1 Tax=Embleya scabrispora TaxID=159449 RepID=A0A1T3NNN0_9ACTN|nr:hypothetical protein [Embleya scabrispora]OPC78434.1 hypothetical protein B4N89_35845 [Embleya scabrispora]